MIVTTIGAGRRGQTVAGVLGVAGHSVRLVGTSDEVLKAVHRQGGIRLTGAVEGFGQVHYAGRDLNRALEGAELVLIATSCTSHRHVAERLLPRLGSDQTIVLLPGCTGGALEVRRVLVQGGTDLPVAEANGFLYESQSSVPGQIHITRVKRQVRLAAIPNEPTQAIVGKLRQLFPNVQAASSVLETSLNNIDCVLQPSPILMNAGRIEYTEGAFFLYRQGVTPAVSRLIERLDEERCALCRALEVPYLTLKEWLHVEYDVDEESLYSSIQAIQRKVTRNLRAPKRLDHRRLTEGVGAGLVPLASIGKVSSVPMLLGRSLIRLASLATNTDFYSEGRNAASMGISGFDTDALLSIVM